MNYSVIIPTKNRHSQLLECLTSIFHQIHQPEQIIIVDQTANRLEECAFSKFTKSFVSRIQYHHCPTIRSLVEAKHFGLMYADEQFIGFLDDDVILDPEFYREIKTALANNPSIAGCCGRFTNFTNTSLKRNLYRVFAKGMFSDERPFVYGTSEHDSACRSKGLSQGCSVWRRDVLLQQPYDLRSQFHFIEDTEYSSRIFDCVSRELFIIPTATAVHKERLLNCEEEATVLEKTVIEAFNLRRLRKEQRLCSKGLKRMLVYWFIRSITISVGWKSGIPFRGFCLGVLKSLLRN